MTYTREGGFRWPLLARLTNGRYGLGRWTQKEVDDLWDRANKSWLELNKYFD